MPINTAVVVSPAPPSLVGVFSGVPVGLAPVPVPVSGSIGHSPTPLFPTGIPIGTGPASPLSSDLVKSALRKKLAERHHALVTDPLLPEDMPVPVVPEPAVVAEVGQTLFTKLVGVPLSKLAARSLPDFGVTVLDDSAVHEAMAGFLQVVDPCYNLQVAEAHAILLAWETGDKCLVVGPTGSGKSSLVKHLCALTHRPMLRINMTGDIESATLFGQLVVEGGATVWKDGPMSEGVRYGAVVVTDEWDVTPPEILFGLQWLFEEHGRLFLKEMPGDSSDKFIVPHVNFRLCCLGNTLGQGDDSGRYSGTNVQNNASIDRFQTTVVIDYLDAKHEIKIITDACPSLSKEDAKKMVSFAAMVRTAANLNKINLTMSPRTLVNWGRKKVALRNDIVALRLAFTNKLRESDRHIVSEFYTSVFGGKEQL